MCDSTTEAENAAYLEATRLTRRDVNLGAGAAIASWLTGCEKSSPPPAAPKGATLEPTAAEEAPPAPSASTELEPLGRNVTISTPDGTAEGFFVTPKDGKHPGVLMWPDIAGVRDAYRKMATRLATSGYSVLLVNHYYRSSRLPVLGSLAEWRTDEGRAKIAPMKDALTPEAISRDGVAFVAWLDGQPEVDRAKRIASSGYCMTGSYTLRTAAAVPDRVGAIASFHGGGLVTPEPTSPHLLLSRLKGGALFCIARSDDEREPEIKGVLRQAADAARVPAEIEVYPAQHGWCCIDSPVYDVDQANRAWARMLATFEKYL